MRGEQEKVEGMEESMHVHTRAFECVRVCVRVCVCVWLCVCERVSERECVCMHGVV